MVALAAAGLALLLMFARSDGAQGELEAPDESAEAAGERARGRAELRPALENSGHNAIAQREEEGATTGVAAAPQQLQPAQQAADAEAPFEPVVREHAKQMLVPATATAIEGGNVRHLQEVLRMVNAHRAEKLLSEADIGAIEAAIACLERAPDAREEAADLLRFGAPTALAESLQKACAAR
jgi:hypothetical protein